MTDHDPFSWSVDQVIDQVCSSNSALRSSFTIKSTLDFNKLETAFRENDIDGENLLSLEDANIKDDLGVSSFGQRRDLRKIILHLRTISTLYQSSLSTSNEKNAKRPLSELATSSPEPHSSPQPKRRRIQPLNISTEPLTDPNDFDPNDLSDQWIDFLNRHQEDSDEDILRPYAESNQSMELDTDDDKSLIAEMDLDNNGDSHPTIRPLSRQELNQTIDEAVKDYKDIWNNSKRSKKYGTARRRWLRAAKAGTRKPQQYMLEQELQQMQTRLAKFRKAILDMSSEYHKIEEVKQNCANLQATAEDCAEREYYLEVLKSNDPPEKPVEPVMPQYHEDMLLEGEELLQSSDTEPDFAESEDSDDYDMMDTVSDDESGLSLPYDPADDDWKPVLPASAQSKQTDPAADVFVDHSSQISNNNNLGTQAQEFHLNSISQSPLPQADKEQSPSLSRSKSISQGAMTMRLPISPPKKRQTPPPAPNEDVSYAESVKNEFKLHLDVDEIEPLPESRYHKWGASKDNAITIASSPSAREDSVSSSDHSVSTPPLNPQPVQTHTVPKQENWPDIQATRALKWGEVRNDRTALCKAVYSVAREYAKDVFDLIVTIPFTNMSARLRALIDTVMDHSEDESSDSQTDDRLNEDPELLWLRFFVTFTSKKGYPSIWDFPHLLLEEAYVVIASKLLSRFDRLLKPLLQYYISTKTKPAAGTFQRSSVGGQPTKPSISTSISSTPYSKVKPSIPVHTPSHSRRRSKSQDTSNTLSDTESPSENPSTSVRRRKRVVQESQEALAQQAAGQTRIHEQEQRLLLLMDKFNSQEKNLEERRVPINTDPDNVVFLDQHIARRIKDHQITGIQFLWREVIADSKHHGALLAHTMGLGKTMQVISFLVTLAQCNMSNTSQIRNLIPKHLRSGKVLIMCPASLLDNWYDELLLWSPPDRRQLLGDFYKASGLRNEKLKMLQAWSSAAKGILIITYESLRSLLDEKKLSEQEQDHMQKVLLESPSIVVADEAHKLKNAKSALSKMAQKFKSTSRIALTGSPLNNHLEEYHTMIDWIAPGYLGTMVQFRAKYSEPIERGLWEDSTRWERRQSLERLYVLKRDLAPKVDRKDISAIAADMPQKTEFYITISLTEVQTQIYKLLVRHFLGSIQNGQVTAKGSNAQLWSWLAILSWLCNHPSLLIDKLEEKISMEPKITNPTAGETDENDEDTLIPANMDLTETSLTTLLPQLQACFNDQTPDAMANPDLSVRALITQMLIEEAIQIGQKTLLFSHSIPTLDFLERMLQKMGVQYLRIDGSTRQDHRQAYTKDFNNDAHSDLKVFLISTRAGGLGLNLQGANRVIIYDFGFNPSWEEQAVGRAYRLGQQKPVFVYKLRAGGTFEDAIYNKSIFKTQLFSRVVDQRNVVRHAKKEVEDYLFIPQPVDLADFSECSGKDELLDRVLQRAPGLVRNLILTETFQREDEDDELTPEEQNRAEEQVKLESLARNDPEAFDRLTRQMAQRQLAADRARQQAALMAQNANAAAQPPTPLTFEQVFHPSVSNHVQFPGGNPEAVGVARGVQEEPVPGKPTW